MKTVRSRSLALVSLSLLAACVAPPAADPPDDGPDAPGSDDPDDTGTPPENPNATAIRRNFPTALVQQAVDLTKHGECIVVQDGTLHCGGAPNLGIQYAPELWSQLQGKRVKQVELLTHHYRRITTNWPNIRYELVVLLDDGTLVVNSHVPEDPVIPAVAAVIATGIDKIAWNSLHWDDDEVLLYRGSTVLIYESGFSGVQIDTVTQGPPFQLHPSVEPLASGRLPTQIAPADVNPFVHSDYKFTSYRAGLSYGTWVTGTTLEIDAIMVNGERRLNHVGSLVEPIEEFGKLSLIHNAFMQVTSNGSLEYITGTLVPDLLDDDIPFLSQIDGSIRYHVNTAAGDRGVEGLFITHAGEYREWFDYADTRARAKGWFSGPARKVRGACVLTVTHHVECAF